MPRPDPNEGLMPSVLDRLIDPDSTGTVWRRGYGIEQMFAVVQRDLEDLLNTRSSTSDLPDAFVELHNSIFGYGLPDLVSLEAITPQQREDIGRVLEARIARFEPRLKDVHARMITPADSKERTVRFHVEARLCLEPAPEVAFDTILELATGHYAVKPSGA
jgi:type VI secretion system protein ImpF